MLVMMILNRYFLFTTFLGISLFKISFAFSLLDWFDWSSTEKPDGSQNSLHKNHDGPVSEGVTLISVPFEELGPEDKFLLEAEKFSIVSLGLSGLDTCEHRVVMKIQTTCSDMTEEVLAKLSIRLLNCQSEISGRNQVPCTDDMSLKECTAPMDSETWNAYHIINNRARAVCYAMRQQQFRALTEMTVNKLMRSALNQVSTMDNLEDLQKELSILTADTMSSLREGQQGLLDQSSGMQLAQTKVRDSIAANLKQLSNEKTLIQSTQDQLKTLSGKLAQKFDDVESQLELQSEQHKSVHQEILYNLAEITHKTNAVWDAIDEKSRQLQQQQDQIEKRALETLENLKQINESVNYLLALVSLVRGEVQEKILWATNAVGGDRATLLAVLQHVGYLLAGVLVSLFLQLSLVCRLLLLITVLSNVGLVYYHQPLGFLPLTAITVGVWSVALLVPFCWSAWKKRTVVVSKENEISSKEEEEEEDNRSTKSSSTSGSVSLNNNIPKSSSFIGDLPFKDNSLTSLRYRSSLLNSDTKDQCEAVCRNGQSCRSTPTPGHKFCRRHLSH